MPRITSEKTYSAGPRREASTFNVKKLLALILIPLLVAGLFAGAYLKRDTLKAFVISLSDKETSQQAETEETINSPTEPQDSLDDITPTNTPSHTNIPPEQPKPEITPQSLHQALQEAYKAPIVHTKGTINAGEKKVAFDTVWTPDHVSGSGSLTYNGKQTETYLVEKMILIRNHEGVVGDLIGKPVPMEQWVILNANDDLNNIYPDVSLLQGIAHDTQVRNDDPTFSTEKYNVTLNPEKTLATGVGSPQGSWSIQPGSGEQIQVPGPDIQIQGKVEKTPEGEWKVFRFAQ